MSSRSFLLDASTRHSIFLQQYAQNLENRLGARLSRSLRSVYGAIIDNPIEAISSAQFGSLQLELADTLTTQYDALGEALLTELRDLAEAETDFSVELFDRATTTSINRPPADLVITSILLEPIDVAPGRQMTIREALNQFTRKKREQINQILKDAYTDGITSQQAITRIQNIVPLQRRQIGAIVRTGANATSTLARNKAMLENIDIFTGYEWVSTLDSRTSDVCIARDGKIYSFNANNPRPPAHWGCRSTIIPRINPRFDLGARIEGQRPAIGPAGPEQVGGRTTYQSWLRKQPASFQDRVLGVTKGRLFREGAFSVDQFVNEAGRSLTLDELRATNPEAFQ